MSKSTIVVAIDDNDPRLEYSGPWSSSPYTTELGYGGGVLNHSIHAAGNTGSTVTFQFHGSAIGFFGSLNVTDNSTLPTYTCRVDGISFGTDYPYGFWGPTNQYPLCENIALDDDWHTATLTVDTVHTDSNYETVPLLLDYVGYWPSEGAPLNDTTQQIQFNDTRITFSAGWSVYGNFEYHHYSSQRSSTVEFTFEGQSVILYAFIPNGTFTEGEGSYVLDGDDPTSFTIPASRSRTSAYFNHPYFNLTGLSEGNHTLTVTDNTNHNDQSPMTVSYFQIVGYADRGNGESEGTSGLGVAAVVGIAVGAVALLAILAILLVWCKVVRPRRKKLAAAKAQAAVPPMRINLNDDTPQPHSTNYQPQIPPTPGSAEPFFPHQNGHPAAPPLSPQGDYYHTQPPSATQPLRPTFQTAATPVTFPTTPAINTALMRSPSISNGRPGSSHSSLSHSPLTPYVTAAQSQPPSLPDGQQLITRSDSGMGTRMSWAPQHHPNTSRPSVNKRRPGSANSTSSRHQGNNNGKRPGSSGSNSAEAQTRFVTHTDSGVRMGWRDPRDVQGERLDPTNVQYMDVPPEYRET